MIQYLYDTRKLDPEIQILAEIPQDEKNHPEGDVFTHTLMVLDEAAEISARENLNGSDNAILRLSALCHDFGKVTHTQIVDGKITAYGHPEAGIVPAASFLMRSKVNPHIMTHILPLVKYHMAWVGFYTPDITSRVVRRLVSKIQPTNLYMLSLIVEADMSGRGGKWYKQGLPERMNQILKVASTLNNPVDVYPDPLLSGDDIKHITGIPESPLLGKVKAALYKAQLEGRFTTKDEGTFFLLTHVVIAENS